MTPVNVYLVLYRAVSILYFTVYTFDVSSQSVLIEHHWLVSGTKAYLLIVSNPVYNATLGQHRRLPGNRNNLKWGS